LLRQAEVSTPLQGVPVGALYVQTFPIFKKLKTNKIFYSNDNNGPCIIFTLIIRSFVWQLHDKIVRFFLNFIRNSEIVEE